MTKLKIINYMTQVFTEKISKDFLSKQIGLDKKNIYIFLIIICVIHITHISVPKRDIKKLV